LLSLKGSISVSVKKNLTLYFKSFVDVLFPRYCLGCEDPLETYEKYFCTACAMGLSVTDFYLQKENVLQQHLRMRFELFQACALFQFHKQGVVAHLVHAFKYEGNVGLGKYLATWLGTQLQQSPFYQNITHIVPVPLHRRRKRKRGFNQAFVIAKELEKKLGVRVAEGLLKRVKNTQQLARIGGSGRWKEVKDAFLLQSTSKSEKPHFLLVDDVITTGATLTACAQELLKIPQAKVSIAALACRL